MVSSMVEKTSFIFRGANSHGSRASVAMCTVKPSPHMPVHKPAIFTFALRQNQLAPEVQVCPRLRLESAPARANAQGGEKPPQHVPCTVAPPETVPGRPERRHQQQALTLPNGDICPTIRISHLIVCHASVHVEHACERTTASLSCSG